MYSAFGVEHDPIEKMVGPGWAAAATAAKKGTPIPGVVKPPTTGVKAGFTKQKNKVLGFTQKNPGTALGLAGGAGLATGYGASQYGGTRQKY